GWTDISSNEVGYLIERSIDGANFTQISVVDANTVTAPDSGLLATVTYYYRVRGTNFAGVSDYSNVASVTAVAAVAPPQAPANLVAAADNGTDHYRSQMLLRWDDASANEAAFLIERSADALLFLPVATIGANSTSYLDKGLDTATVYFYRLRAVNGVGQSQPTAVASDQTHPRSQFVRAGETAVFHAGVEGAPVMRYQWQFNGADLLDETNGTLVITNAWITNDGQYAVILRGTEIATVSKSVFLTVAAVPRILSEPQGAVYK